MPPNKPKGRPPLDDGEAVRYSLLLPRLERRMLVDLTEELGLPSWAQTIRALIRGAAGKD